METRLIRVAKISISDCLLSSCVRNRFCYVHAQGPSQIMRWIKKLHANSALLAFLFLGISEQSLCHSSSVQMSKEQDLSTEEKEKENMQMLLKSS